MMFGEVVRMIVGASFPVDDELALSYAIADPVETHVDGFGLSLFDSVIGYSLGGAVVSLNGGGRLWVAQFSEGNANGAGIFGVVEEATKFGLGGAGEDMFHYAATDMDSAVEGRRWIVRAGCFGRVDGCVAEEM
jgi:hypothetical protein